MNKNTKFLITGANGQLAREFISSLGGKGLPCLALQKGQLDITDFEKTEKLMREEKPDILINCAAYNHVDLAEKHPRKAFAVNGDAVKNLAEACKDLGILMVHFSSDYVFDGQKNAPYTEDDHPNPLNTYGESKLKGEEAIQDALDDYLIFRLSWVFGDGKQNFLHKLSQWAENGESLKITDNEISVPTFTEDAVKVVLLALKRGLQGTYHLTNSGQCSRYEWAKYYFSKKGIDVKIQPVTLNHFSAKAKRPLKTVMSNKNVCDALNIAIPDWRNAVDLITSKKRKKDDMPT